ncbi:class I SAM-dependent methyltransferase [Planctomycetota bacterium]
MRTTIKRLAWAVTPPILWLAARAALGRIPRRAGGMREGEQNSAYYDRVYAERVTYHAHYSTSPYYFLWSVIADRLLGAGVSSVLDVGCGPGQFADLLRDRGMERYCGVDLSRTALRLARSVCPEWEFTFADALETELFDTLDYEAVVCMEVLEHLDSDIELLKRVPPNVRFYGSVPSFPDTAHVRYFSHCDAVFERYGSLFHEFRVDPLAYGDNGRQLFVLQGVKS